MPWVRYVLSLILFRHNSKGRKQTSNWQKYNNCSEFCSQCHNSLWRESLTDSNVNKDIMLSSFVSFILTLSTWELPADFSFFQQQQRQQRYHVLIFVSFILILSTWELPTDFPLCLAIFPFDFLKHNCLQKVIIKISWVLEQSIFMTRPSPRDFLKYAFKQNCRNCFKTIRIRDETYKLRSKLTLSSSGLIHFHPTSLSWGKYYLRRLIDGCAGLKVLGKTPVQDHHRLAME